MTTPVRGTSTRRTSNTFTVSFAMSGVRAVEVLALRAPAQPWEHVKRHPDVLERGLQREAVAARHVPI
jgi:hypothetical protein